MQEILWVLPSLCLNLNIFSNIFHFLMLRNLLKAGIEFFHNHLKFPHHPSPLNFGLEITYRPVSPGKKKENFFLFFWYPVTRVPQLLKQIGASLHRSVQTGRGWMDCRIFSIHPENLGRGRSRKMDPRTWPIQQLRQKHQLNLKLQIQLIQLS